MSPPAYAPVPLSPIDEEKAMLSSSYDASDKEALLPMQQQQHHAMLRSEQSSCPFRKRWARGLLIALRLVSLTVFVVAVQQYFAQRGQQHGVHLHENSLQGHAVDRPSWLPPWGHGNDGEHKSPKHGPPHHHHHPHGPHMGPPPPRAIECFDISSKDAAVNMSLALHDAAQPIFLTPSLAESSDISIVRTGKAEGSSSNDMTHPPPPPPGPPSPPPPPGHPPHKPPRGPPGPPGMPCHRGHPTTIMVELEREEAKSSLYSSALDIADLDSDEDKDKKEQKVFFCSLRMPMGQRGIGLFSHDISKPPEHKPEEPPKEGDVIAIDADKKEKKEKKPKEPEHPPHGPKVDYPHVALKINVPAGQPFTLTSNPPPPPPPPMRKPWFHWGPPRVPSGPWPHPKPHPHPEPPHRGPPPHEEPPHHGGEGEQRHHHHHQAPPAEIIAHKGKMDKPRHVIIITITRFFSRVRKATGCGSRALVRKVMGKQ